MIKKGMFIGNRYEILDRVGSGGMSDVYKAKDHKLNRYVAIKVLKSEFSKDKNFVSKFRVEAQSAARLEHPNIVNVYDVGEDTGLYYIVMELVEGITLKQYIARKQRLSVKEATSIAIQIAQGIECAHNNQIIHRDIKPQNIIISREGKVKVTDFGIAKAASANTINGNAMGSVHYISPEQARGGYVDERSDIYSLGITTYEMLTGNVPFDGDNTVNIALQHIQQNVPDVRGVLSELPISISKIVLKCTQNKSDRRYPKIALVIADLKKSLVNPYEDFVQFSMDDKNSSTVMITDEEVEKIRNGAENPEEYNIENKEDFDNDDIDAVNPKMDKLITIGGIVVGIIVLVIGIAVITAFVSSNDIEIPTVVKNEKETLDPKQTRVPDVVGITEDEAESALHKESLGFRYIEYVYSDEFESGIICEQSIEPDTIIDKNTTVELKVSKGSQRIHMPDNLIGKKLNDVITKLSAIGLNWKIEYEYNNSYGIDQVISCTPGEKAEVASKEVITLLVSRGIKVISTTTTVPALIGKTESKAKSAITSAGLSVGEIRHDYSESVKKGCVIRQTIKAGGTVPKNTRIGLIISKGKEEAETTSQKVTKSYTGTYTFALEDLLDENGNHITTGAVSVTIDGKPIGVDASHADVSRWTSDYTITTTSPNLGASEIQLLVNGVPIITDVIRFK